MSFKSIGSFFYFLDVEGRVVRLDSFSKVLAPVEIGLDCGSKGLVGEIRSFA